MYKAEIEQMETENWRSYQSLKEKIDKINTMVDAQIELRRIMARNRKLKEEA